MRVTCKACGGTGLAPLKHAHQITYDAVTQRWISTGQIRGRLGNRVKPTALANRLVRLAKLGLIERRPTAFDARAYEWRRA